MATRKTVGLSAGDILDLLEEYEEGTKEVKKNVTGIDVVLFPPDGDDSEGDSDNEDEPTGSLSKLSKNMLENYAEMHIDEVEEEEGSGSDSDIEQNPNDSDISNPQPQPPMIDNVEVLNVEVLNVEVHGGVDDDKDVDFIPSTPPRKRVRDNDSPMILPPAPVSPPWQSPPPHTPQRERDSQSPVLTPPPVTPPGRERDSQSPVLTPPPMTPPQPGTSGTQMANKKLFSDSDTDSESPPPVSMSQPPLMSYVSPYTFSDDTELPSPPRVPLFPLPGKYCIVLYCTIV